MRRDRVLMVVDAETDAPRDGRPVREYDVLRQRLEADVLDRNSVRRHWLAGRIAKRFGMPAGLTALACLRFWRHATVHCDSEAYGIVLSLLVAWAPIRTKVYWVGHKPTRRSKAFALSALRASRGTAGVLVNATSIARRLVSLGVPPDRIHLVPIAVDTQFWSPRGVRWPGAAYVSSAGVEMRDYPTLVAALAQVPDLEGRLAAASPYSRHGNSLDGLALPDNVHRVDCSTAGLRDLYETSAFVAVAIFENETCAGLTTIAEAMSMGKAVVCTRTEGQVDTVTDRRAWLRPSGVTTRGTITAAADQDAAGPTGLYVRPGDIEDLRAAMCYLAENPDVAREFGRRGRRVAEQFLSVERLGAMVADILEGGKPVKSWAA